MSDDINEVSDITSICNSLAINIGTLNRNTIESMLVAGKQANKLGHPVILDPVGIGASKLRNDCVNKLLENIKFSVIRGNISEIKSIYYGSGSTKGVDANQEDFISFNTLDEYIKLAKELSQKTGSIIAISGEIDIVSDGNKTYVIKNGHPNMAKITGSGCMLTSVIASYCGANYNNILDATATAVCSIGLCGELANKKMIETNSGLSSFVTYLIDYMSNMDNKMLDRGAKIEIR